MSKIDIPLSQLSLAQKLELMEKLWADLTQGKEEVNSPAWHEAVLRDREDSLAAGRVSESDWEDAKKRIRKRIS